MRDDLDREVGLMSPHLHPLMAGFFLPKVRDGAQNGTQPISRKSASPSYEPNAFFPETYAFRQKLLILSAQVYSNEHN